jgi:hypothetical protein
MPQSPPKSLRLRLKVAVLGALGAAIIVLPMGQVLRYQGSDIEALLAERARLDPLAQALDVQIGLLEHRDVADRVLRGRRALEEERRLRQAGVNQDLSRLQGTLSAGVWVRALGETAALTRDWQTLAQQITQRQLAPVDSRNRHELLVEQIVQVMDLVSALAAPTDAQHRLWLALVRAPRGDEDTATDPAAPTASHGPGLARLHTLREAMAQQVAKLDTRQAAVSEQRAAVQGALAALLLALAAALTLAARASRPGPLGRDPDGDGVRRSQGRRVTDGPPPGGDPKAWLQPLRERDAALRGAASDSPPTGY